ncbi:Dothistromin biosynthesis peroxidase dotB [Fulvia fulva]|uniref:Dothistromin biosynthesis peroxidase dotB n=1 Tax=Passalora fulva TaxID=5499 RepID=A0A9Q8LI82_PASFU|nr:Dothistromin biosynthesis peroxidase dotB [Fulvia fulva]KAK4624417.1 Dothistromin biosynthesis peroxidase dotB [Fulvia fulva]KAK4626012.1 Dothistromin biosynthesis peroxidase dotB [Fulvia fulva]UJO17860.1 Dothistromin biosynthesis peroxidase dotB [Fulvia fulva]WPV15301.1 Dothistromin biosynthesis peroxidase dotB [Fulvia fulva]WPV29752.1 Dothistromin biosynthesis peroxidase dotB [Fulvia fulva]
MRRWEHLWNLGETHGLDEAAAQSYYNTRWSILNNPCYFSSPLGGLLAPAATRLPVDMMSNHSAEVPGGTLMRDVLKSFFSVSGDAPGEFVWTPGNERIPQNWYKRASLQAFTATEAILGVFTLNSAYPGIYRLGGNTGTVNSFTGVDTANFTGGIFNLETLTQGNNAACFFLQASLSDLPDAAAPVLGAIGSALGWVIQQLGPSAEALGCPQLKAFNNDVFNQFPGAAYIGSGEA